MADKCHNAWIIREKATEYRIAMTCNQKKIMLNSIYGYMAGGGHNGL